MATYVYDKLDPKRKQIRICTIHPGAFEDPISCSLRTVSLDDDPEYETLSYAWGAPVRDHTVLVDGAALKVTGNLYNALRFLRRQQRPFSEDDYESRSDNASKGDETTPCWDPEASGVLWADAVCINQADYDERSSQVKIMGDVYRRGVRLHVWIGTTEEIRYDTCQKHPLDTQHDHPDLVTPERLAELRTFLLDAGITARPTPLASAESSDADADVKGAMEILQLFAKNKHAYELPFFKSTAGDIELENNKFWYKCMAMLLGILTQPWWKRVWVVQEVVLSSTAKANTLLHISHHKMSLSSCDSVGTYWKKHNAGCCHQWNVTVLGNRGLLQRQIDAWESLHKLTRVLECYKDGTFKMTLAHLVFSSREAANPHDYVYGFRGLMKDSPSDLEVDYRKPDSSLYSTATKAIFRAYGSMELLEQAVGVDAEDRHHLPSWCLDWSERGENKLFEMYGLALFNAARGCSQPFQHPCEDDNTLIIEAITAGRIISVNTVIEETDIDPVDHVVRWMRAIGHRDLEDGINTVLKVLMRDHHLDDEEGCFRRISPDFMKIVIEWKDFISSNNRRPNGTTAEAQLFSIEYNMRKRQRLFMTSHRQLGSGRPSTREGDCLFVVKGSQCPLLLRPLHDSAIKNGQQDFPSYHFVGRCYVHGIMDGEAVDANTEWQTIRLR
ncbi:MAG: hypothetical protein L6R38_007871 [Xanthoria sp. 2 TBL-2021]|nr:MAG: hypothetical protein L6R38_007871 [Xanthoria sp. 2 TBL-2021]